MTSKPRVCLVVDNPLRDLDGLILVAWYLVRQGADVWLVPMYDQGFDVRAIGADLVLLNYIRPNNYQHALAYMHRGIKVGVLDTEGMAGKSSEEFAVIISRSQSAHLMDFYCVWGKGQYAALRAGNVIPEAKMALTGCPRYDYCALPWRNSLSRPAMAPGYVLINTNFPVVNPRFTSSSKEGKAMVSGGFTVETVTNYMRDAGIAFAAMKALIGRLVARFPHQHFVLRPHPFESTEPYTQAIQAPNFEVRQEGTSIEALNHARVLIQLNCLTAIEAAAFGIPSLSPGWLDNPVLHVPLSSQLSTTVDSESALVDSLTNLFTAPAAVMPRASTPLIDAYLYNDGNAAERVAKVILQALAASRDTLVPPVSWRFQWLQAVRTMVGAACYNSVRDRFYTAAIRARKKSKLFSAEYVASMVTRIDRAADVSSGITVRAMNECDLRSRRLATGHSICLSGA